MKYITPWSTNGYEFKAIDMPVVLQKAMRWWWKIRGREQKEQEGLAACQMQITLLSR